MTSRVRFCRFVVSAALLVGAVVVLQPLQALAQTDQGRITGTVMDQSGALVAGATVTVRNERTGEERQTTTNESGRFLVASLKASTYTVRTTRDEFAPLAYDKLQLSVGQALVLDLTIHPAGVAETVQVTAAPPVIDLSSARVGINVSQYEVSNLPINGRQMSQLLLQAPGSQNAGSGTWQDIRFSGRAVEQNAIRYDGIDASAIIDAAPGNINGELASPFKLQASIENVQEFRVESSAYPAEYGTGSGGQVGVVTKSGGNLFHGSAFEYVRNDKFDAPNYFDTYAKLPKSLLRMNQFGGSIGGPLLKDRAFFFGSYEGYRLGAGVNIVEAVPSGAAWARAVPLVAALRPGFLAPGAVILPGKSASPDFDIAQLQTSQVVKEDAFSGRFDFRLGDRWSSFFRFLHDEGVSDAPDNVAGRVIRTTAKPTNAVFSLQGILSNRITHELKVGYNAAPTRLYGRAPVVNGVDLSSIFISLSGAVANTGIAGQGASSGITSPGGLIRANSAQNGRSQPYDAYAFSLIDSLGWLRGNHYVKVGGEYRMIRMTTDRLGGVTYSFQNLNAFLANTASTIQFLGDESAPSVFNNGATGPRHLQQWYGIGYVQDEWRASRKFTLNYGVRYDYYSVMKEQNNLQVKFNIDTGVIDPNTTPAFLSTKTNFQPRVGGTYRINDKTVLKGGFGLFVGPGQTEDQIQPQADSDRVSTTLSSGTLTFPVDPAVAVANFTSNPNNRSYQPRAYANEYTIPERIWSFTGSVQREFGGNLAATAAYIGSRGRNLFLRSVTNQITQVVTNPNPASAAIVVRQFSIVQKDGSGNIVGVQNPFAEIDYKTSGGRDSYNGLQLSLSRPSADGLAVNAQYTLSKSFGNTSGSNEALTSANLARTLSQFDYDLGYNSFDVRHTFNLSAIYSLPFGHGRRHDLSGVTGALLGGWDVGGIVNARSGLPIDVRITRPDVLYKDAAGNYFNNPAADRIAVINTPGGGNTRNVRRPDVVPGVDPYVKSGGLLFLNPAAFTTPKPGTWGNLQRGLLHGPKFLQVDMLASKRFHLAGRSNVEFRAEIFNLLNRANFINPAATLPNALPSSSLTESNKVQPGQPFSNSAAGTFGQIQSTVARTVGIGTNRQVQLAIRVSF